MNDRQQAWMFEVYRYSVCFVMLLVFVVMGFSVISGLIADPNNTTALGSAGAALVLSALIYALHWRMKNPGLKV